MHVSDIVEGLAGIMGMPFLASTLEGGEVLFFCRAEEGYRWQIWMAEENAVARRLEIGLPGSLVMHSPTAWQDEAGWHVTFLAHGLEADPPSHLYRMGGPSLEQLEAPVAVRQTELGYVHRGRVVWGDHPSTVRLEDEKGTRVIELAGAILLRVCPRSDALDRILLSGRWPREAEVFTLEVDLETGRQRFVECDHGPALEASILGDAFVYRAPKSMRLEVSRAPRYRTVRAALVRRQEPVVPEGQGGPCSCKGARLVPVEPPDLPPTRLSCLECVEKHLGAAYVLLTETRSGYAHRLRAVGHLHEAEDESQAWGSLNQAIRAARRAFQVMGLIPDWARLQGLVEAARGRHAPQ